MNTFVAKKCNSVFFLSSFQLKRVFSTLFWNTLKKTWSFRVQNKKILPKNIGKTKQHCNTHMQHASISSAYNCMQRKQSSNANGRQCQRQCNIVKEHNNNSTLQQQTLSCQQILHSAALKVDKAHFFAFRQTEAVY